MEHTVLQTAPTEPIEHKKTCLKPSELMTMLDLGRTLVYRELRNGNIPSIRLGKRVLIPRILLENWLASGGKIEASK